MLATMHQNTAAASLVMLTNHQHHEILDALDKVRQLYDERSATPLLIEAIDEIYATARIHFHDEEELLGLQDDLARGAHRELHKRMLGHIVSMRRHMECFDRADLLYQLRFLDRWLLVHISDEIMKSSLGMPDEPDDHYSGRIGLHAPR